MEIKLPSFQYLLHRLIELQSQEEIQCFNSILCAVPEDCFIKTNLTRKSFTILNSEFHFDVSNNVRILVTFLKIVKFAFYCILLCNERIFPALKFCSFFL